MLKFSLCPLVIGIALNATWAQTWQDMKPKMFANWAGVFTCVAINPRNPNQAYAGSESGGLYKSEDGGMHWELLRSLDASQITDVEVNAAGNSVVVTARADSKVARQLGIYRSGDNGRTWTSPPESLMPTSATCPTACNGNTLAFVPGTDIVYAGNDCGLLRSTDAGATWESVRGTLAGAWVLKPLVPHQIMSLLAVDATHVLAGGPNGLFFTTNGTTWQQCMSPADGMDMPHGLAAAPGSPRILFRTENWTGKLRYSLDDGATWLKFPVTPPTVSNVGPFVVTGVNAVDAEKFDLYFGDGFTVSKITLGRSPSTWGTSQWNTYEDRSRTLGDRLSFEHGDFRHICMSADRRFPVLAATDGGVQKWQPGIDFWKMVGGNVDGINALEIDGLSSVYLQGGGPQLSFITWHNGGRLTTDHGRTWGNAGNMEDAFIRTSAAEVADLTQLKMAMGTDKSEVWSANLQTVQGDFVFPTPTTFAHNISFFTSPTTGKAFYLCTTLGFEGNFATYHVREIGQEPWYKVGVQSLGGNFGVPMVGKVNAQLVLYQVYQDVTGRRKLCKIPNFAADLMRVQSAIACGNAGISYIAEGPINGAWQEMVAVNPFDGNHLIAADIGVLPLRMSQSHDGGETWQILPQLTNLVTAGGTLNFRTNGKTAQATVIEFDPYHRGRIAVGTQDAGLIVSEDGGLNWANVSTPGQLVKRISAIQFDRFTDIYVASSGMGLWRFRPRMVPREGITLAAPLQTRFLNPLTGVAAAAKAVSDAGSCAGCTWVIAREGAIRDFAYDPKSKVVTVQASQPSAVYQYGDPSGDITLDVKGVSTQATFPNCPACLGLGTKFVKAIALGREGVQGVLPMEDAEWKSVGPTWKPTKAIANVAPTDPILEAGNLPLEDVLLSTGTIKMNGAPSGHDQWTFAQGSVYKLIGSGFDPAADGNDSIAVFLDGILITKVKPTVRGGFAVTLGTFLLAGAHQLEVIERKAGKRYQANATIWVRSKDE